MYGASATLHVRMRSDFECVKFGLLFLIKIWFLSGRCSASAAARVSPRSEPIIRCFAESTGLVALSNSCTAS